MFEDKAYYIGEKLNPATLAELDTKLNIDYEGLARLEKKSTRDRAAHIVKNSIPNTITNFSFYLSTTISFSFLASYSSDNTKLLAACGIGASIVVSAYYSIFYSLNTAVLNLGSQAIGSKNYELVGYTLHRALIINTLLMLPLAFLISKSGSLLILTGIDEEVAQLDMIPAVSLSVVFNTLHYYLIAQGILYPQVISLSSFVAIQYFLCLWMITSGSTAYSAIIYSKLIVEILNVTALVIYISRNERLAKTWFRPRRKSFRKLFSQLKTGFEGGSITYFEVLVYEIMTLMSGMMANTQVAAQAAFLNFSYVSDSLCIGVGSTLAALVSEKLGTGSKKETVGYIRAGLIIVAVLSLTMVGISISCSNFIVGIYTKDTEVIPIMTSLLAFYPLFIIFNCPFQATSGLLRSLGMERFALISYFTVYYFIALPIAYVLGISYEMGTLGLWIGIGFGTAVLCLMGLYMICFQINISQQIRIIKKRLNHFDDQLTIYEPSMVLEMKELPSPVA
eukprot:CAMPEP_0176438416 /NCGR_PEP_ID=MMETSP0127-20121128/19268_1 /TAXON_ID=938130 /ORGANISM="Platyophrya macrostoma, Strain WH" /LENGTH=506 /DNA_ID=CAMNT_0017822357 /DNA_START=26 /DNA_END=1546 /DNA_ORIENTATION=+